jgi:hypothetical protein
LSALDQFPEDFKRVAGRVDAAAQGVVHE